MGTVTEQHELEERELVLNPKPIAFMDVHTVKVNKTSLILRTKDREQQAEFKRSGNKDCLKMTFKWRNVSYKICSEGHRHEVKGEQEKYDFYSIPWDYVEVLVEWLQRGNWRQVNNKPPAHVGTLNKCLALLTALENTESAKLMKSEIKKLKAEIREQVGQ